MHEKLEALKDAWDKTLDGGRDEVAARAAADAYVAEFPDKFTEMATMPVAGDDGLVAAVDGLRAGGPLMEERLWEVEAWLLHHYDPQAIGGVAEPTVRVV